MNGLAMGYAEVILWGVFTVSAILFWWVGKSFMSQPDYNVPEIFRNPVIGKLLVLTPQLWFLAVAILGFVFTENGWWYLGAVIAAVILLSSRPQPFWKLHTYHAKSMSKVCPKCNSSNVADIVYGLVGPGGLPEGCVAGGCAVDPCIKWRCQSCGFDWGPVDCLRDSANNLEEEYWRGAESCLSLKEAGQKDSTHLSKIKKKILDRKELNFYEVEMIEFDISTCSIDMAMQANKYVRDEYEKQLAQVREGKIIDVDEETLTRRYENPSNISKLWEAMTNSERSAVNRFRVYYPERIMERVKEFRYKVKIIEGEK